MANLGELVLMGMATELTYEEAGGYRMTDEEQEVARALEAELLLDAAAGVDLRIRLIGAAVSK